MLYFLNSPILTNYGKYQFYKISLDQAKDIWNNTKVNERTSACGHKDTADYMKELGFNIEENRIQIEMKSNDKAIVLRITKRLTEGKVLSSNDLDNINYEFGLLELLEE